MSVRALAAAAAAGLLMHCPGVLAQETPEQVYDSLHRAAIAGSLNEMMRFATEAKRREMQNQPGAADIAKLISAMLPRNYSVTNTTVSPDGTTAQLRALGTGSFLGQTQQLHGTVNFLREGGAWKVDNWEWSDKPGAAPMRVQAKPSAVPTVSKPDLSRPAPAPAPSGPTLRSAQPDCEIKPVMTDEDLRRCGASPR